MIGGWILAGLLLAPAPQAAPRVPETVTGFVFHDRNGNGKREAGEPGVPNVPVSNQVEVVRTDRQGRYTLPAREEMIVFVIKPRGWMTPVDEDNHPRFFYVHKPQGSPNLAFGGVPPTGPLPASVDFPLWPQREPRRFEVIFFGDTQPYTLEQLDFVARDAVAEVAGTSAAFGVTLGDVVGDNLLLLPPIKNLKGRIGIPWHYVLGNHDINFDASGDEHSDDTWERIFGPPYYAFQYGGVHFLNLENIKYTGQRRYTSWLGPNQMAFVRNYLALVPRDELVVLMMHIPIMQLEERRELFSLLKDRPNVFTISAHFHYQQHVFLGPELGWEGDRPLHHLVNVTVSGSWWNGERDEVGIPHSMMRCGAPKGYTIATFDGNRYSLRFKASRRPADYQMNIHAPDVVPEADVRGTEVVVNVFAGSARCKVEMRVGGGDWQELRRTPRPDPFYARHKALEQENKVPATGTPLPGIIDSPHVWSGRIPESLPKGIHTIEVRVTDQFGQIWTGRRTMRVG